MLRLYRGFGTILSYPNRKTSTQNGCTLSVPKKSHLDVYSDMSSRKNKKISSRRVPPSPTPSRRGCPILPEMNGTSVPYTCYLNNFF